MTELVRVRARATAVLAAAASYFLVPGILGQGTFATRGVLGPPIREWRLVADKHWQLVAADVESADVTDAREGTRGACAEGMVEVQGDMKLDSDRGTIEALQSAACVAWISREFPERCARFDRDTWRETSRALPSRGMHFCIDRFEYPDRKGDYPIIAVTWREAVGLCEQRGRRLCTEDEWTFACEGEEALPYANGYTRDATACVIDRTWRRVDETMLVSRDRATALSEVDYLWQGEASGANPRCRSPFGVYDMTGYWGPVRTRCRPSTRAHDEDFYFYQQGFRCCADVK